MKSRRKEFDQIAWNGMARADDNVEAWLLRAREGSESLGQLLQHYRPYLVLAVNQRIDPRIISRVCAADLVQEVFAEAAARFDGFRGTTEPEFSAWLHAILIHVLDDSVRVHVLAEKRSVTREIPLYGHDGSASFYWFDFAGRDSTPSKRLVRGEKALRLAQLIECLPGKQGTAIRLRFFEGMKVRQIAESMSLSAAATAGLLKRGLRTLRSKMNEESWFGDVARRPQ